MNRLAPDADDARFVRRVLLLLVAIAMAAALFRAGDLLVLIGALFFAADPKVYERGFLFLVLPRARPAAEESLFDIGQTLRLWLKAQLSAHRTLLGPDLTPIGGTEPHPLSRDLPEQP